MERQTEIGMQRPAQRGHACNICLILFHPDYDRRLRHLTGSADPDSGVKPKSGARGLPESDRDTAGGELHPALRISADSLKKKNAGYQSKTHQR
ncbi:hypothetical protein GCM10009412_28980 [Aeromonas salmonicida subsp. achromogenes]